MSQQVINAGTTTGDGTGEALHTAFGKANSNFTELYARVNTGGTGTLAFYASSGISLSPLTLGTNLSITGTTLNAAGGGSGTPGGTSGQIQINSSGSFAGLTLGTNLSISGTTLNAAGGASRTIAAGLTATGTTQGTALALTADDSIVTTVASGTGALLRTTNGQVVLNRGANDLSVYPPTGGAIEAAATNAAVTIPPGGSTTFNTANGVQFYAR